MIDTDAAVLILAGLILAAGLVYEFVRRNHR